MMAGGAMMAAMSLTLLDWRRRVAALYADYREAGSDGRAAAVDRLRAGRDELFARHLDSPLDGPGRARFRRLPYAPYDPAWRFEVDVDTRVSPHRLVLHSADGEPTPFTRFGRVELPTGALDVFWLDTYGGGVFLPFADATSGRSTYGAGRYLLDTAKGADHGGEGGRLVLDFNLACNPSCAYDPRWPCPLAPPGNRLAVDVPVGELLDH